MSVRYAIRSLDEAKAYLTHPVLGRRLRQCTDLVLQIKGRSIEQVFGSPDDLKFRSSMTLFAKAATDDTIFKKALDKYFAGGLDERTVALLTPSKE